MKTEKAVVVKGRKKWQDRGKCTYSFTCEDLVKVPFFFFLQFAVTKAAGLNPDFHSAVRFSSGLGCSRRLHQLQEYCIITAFGFNVVNSTVVSPSCHRPNFQPLGCRKMGLGCLNWTLGGGNAASPTEEGVSARRFELFYGVWYCRSTSHCLANPSSWKTTRLAPKGRHHSDFNLLWLWAKSWKLSFQIIKKITQIHQRIIKVAGNYFTLNWKSFK